MIGQPRATISSGIQSPTRVGSPMKRPRKRGGRSLRPNSHANSICFKRSFRTRAAAWDCLPSVWTSYPPFGRCPPNRIKSIAPQRTLCLRHARTDDAGAEERRQIRLALAEYFAILQEWSLNRGAVWSRTEDESTHAEDVVFGGAVNELWVGGDRQIVPSCRSLKRVQQFQKVRWRRGPRSAKGWLLPAVGGQRTCCPLLDC
jgi:hypothetical protein